MRSSSLWIPLALVAITGLWLRAFATNFDQTEYHALGCSLLTSYGLVLLVEWRGRRRRARLGTVTAELEDGGYRSVTRYRCNGELREVVTTDDAEVSLEAHLAHHVEQVLADADSAGCGSGLASVLRRNLWLAVERARVGLAVA